MRKRIHHALEEPQKGDWLGQGIQILLVTLIIGATILAVIETIPGFSATYATPIFWFDTLLLVVFSIEYLSRLLVCVEGEDYRHPILGRIRFALRPLMVVDLLTLLPFYLPMFLSMDLWFLRLIRLTRIFRLFSLAHYYKSLTTITRVIKKKRHELAVTLSFGCILLVISSSLMYFIEHQAQPRVFSSIPAAMWWGVASLTTIGYGDIYPITPLGKVLGAIMSFIGIGMFALPTGILGSGFMEEITHPKSECCPHCGKDIHEKPKTGSLV